MSLLGKAALAMWWDVSPKVNAEFQNWHSHEHFRERLGIPGFKRATRWSGADGGQAVFQMYELEDYDVLSSPHYLARLNAPTPWSTKMMPHHRNMVRSQCRVLESVGGNTARHALVLRISPTPGQNAALQSALRAEFGRIVELPGCVGGHLLRHDAPPIAQTTEQKIRGADQYADWVVVVVGYDLAALQALSTHELSAGGLTRLGAQPGAVSALYTLSFAAVAGEIS